MKYTAIFIFGCAILLGFIFLQLGLYPGRYKYIGKEDYTFEAELYNLETSEKYYKPFKTEADVIFDTWTGVTYKLDNDLGNFIIKTDVVRGTVSGEYIKPSSNNLPMSEMTKRSIERRLLKSR